MFPAILTTLFFSVSAVAGARMTRLVPPVEANLWRVCLATVMLGSWAHSFGYGFGGPALPYFLVSGCIGFGIGDLFLYQAFPILGSRICMIMVHCLAAPLSATVEWLWIGTRITPVQAGCTILILLGVAVALAPREHLHLPRKLLLWGVMCGVIAAFGQGIGAVISRKAYMIATAAHEPMDGLTAAYQRIWGGIAITVGGYFYFTRRQRRQAPTEPEEFSVKWKRSYKWVLLNAIFGPGLGVACFQWALSYTPSGIVLPIVALTPLTIIPLSKRFEGERPSARSLVGSLIAVLGVVVLRIVTK
jgi:drug/metabolite transporter (DMT)-like permease